MQADTAFGERTALIETLVSPTSACVVVCLSPGQTEAGKRFSIIVTDCMSRRITFQFMKKAKDTAVMCRTAASAMSAPITTGEVCFVGQNSWDQYRIEAAVAPNVHGAWVETWIHTGRWIGTVDTLVSVRSILGNP